MTEAEALLYKKIEKYHKNDTWFMYPKDLVNPTDYQKAIEKWYIIRYSDLSTKVYYKNKTIALFDAKGKLTGYEKNNTEIAVYYPITGPYLDLSYWIDYTATNGTKRFYKEKPYKTVGEMPAGREGAPANTSFEIATALWYSDVFSNGTVRSFYRNGTIAIFKFNGFAQVFQSYEKAPTSIYVDCVFTTGISSS